MTISGHFLSLVTQVILTDRRDVLVRVKHTQQVFIPLMVPSEVNELEEKEMFCTKLDSIINQCLSGNTLLVLSDLAAVAGTNGEGNELCFDV